MSVFMVCAESTSGNQSTFPGRFCKVLVKEGLACNEEREAPAQSPQALAMKPQEVLGLGRDGPHLGGRERALGSESLPDIIPGPCWASGTQDQAAQPMLQKHPDHVLLTIGALSNTSEPLEPIIPLEYSRPRSPEPGPCVVGPALGSTAGIAPALTSRTSRFVLELRGRPQREPPPRLPAPIPLPPTLQGPQRQPKPESHLFLLPSM